jgi:predicted peptidase
MPHRHVLASCLVAVAGMTTWARGANVNEFLDFSLRRGVTVLMPGRLYVPPEAQTDPSQPRPLIVFLHGGGDAGTNNVAQLNQNIDDLFAEARRRGAFLLAPQAPLNWRPRTVTDQAMAMLNNALADYNVDARRIYLSGYSSGGGGTWNMLSRYPNRFAAAVPVAPVSTEPDFTPANLVGQPLMAFHARNDGVASVQTTRNVINSILNAARRPLPVYPSLQNPAEFIHSVSDLDFHFVEPAVGDHSVLFDVYRRPALYDWLFAHSLVPEPTCAGLLLTAIVFFPKISRRTPSHKGLQSSSAMGDDTVRRGSLCERA